MSMPSYGNWIHLSQLCTRIDKSFLAADILSKFIYIYTDIITSLCCAGRSTVCSFDHDAPWTVDHRSFGDTSDFQAYRHSAYPRLGEAFLCIGCVHYCIKSARTGSLLAAQGYQQERVFEEQESGVMEIWMRVRLLAVRFCMCHVCWCQSSPVMWHFMFWCVVQKRVLMVTSTWP